MCRNLLVFSSWAILTVAAHAAGFAHSANFVVYTPSSPTEDAGHLLARHVLQAAEQYRRDIAIEWLGKELPTGVGRTVINIELSPHEDTALTWARDKSARQFHAIYLTTSAARASGSTLKHEVAHSILATRWQLANRLPPWTEEGIASRYDDPSRAATRIELIRWFVETGNWPRLESVLDARMIAAEHAERYAAAASLTSFLLELDDRDTFFRFAQEGKQHGWESALASCYGISSMSKLQSRWQGWVSARAAN